MLKKLLSIVIVFVLTTGFINSATVKSDDFNLPASNTNGEIAQNVNLVGVDKFNVAQTTTGKIARNISVSEVISTTTVNPCLLYGIIISSASADGYDPGSDYVIIRDTFVVNTTQSPDFVIMFSTAGNNIAGATHGETWTWIAPVPIKFDYGILATNNSNEYITTLLFRYLKR